MKRLLFGLLLFFTMGLQQVAWADTTSSGATTNAQTNTSGSNTTISGGYSQESTTTYQSGSSSNTTSTTNNNSYSGDTRVTAQSSAPSMSAMSQDLCVVGMSGGIATQTYLRIQLKKEIIKYNKNIYEKINNVKPSN